MYELKQERPFPGVEGAPKDHLPFDKVPSTRRVEVPFLLDRTCFCSSMSLARNPKDKHGWKILPLASTSIHASPNIHQAAPDINTRLSITMSFSPSQPLYGPPGTGPGTFPFAGPDPLVLRPPEGPGPSATGLWVAYFGVRGYLGQPPRVMEELCRGGGLTYCRDPKPAA